MYIITYIYKLYYIITYINKLYIHIYNILFYIGHCAMCSNATSGNSVSSELFLVETCNLMLSVRFWMLRHIESSPCRVDGHKGFMHYILISRFCGQQYVRQRIMPYELSIWNGKKDALWKMPRDGCSRKTWEAPSWPFDKELFCREGDSKIELNKH